MCIRDREQVDTAKAELEKAVQGLQKKVTDNKKPNSGNGTTNTGKAPVTGDPATAMLWLATAASSAAILKRKKK